jgi:sialidase-1
MRTLQLCLVLCLALTGLPVARGATPLLEKINLFENDADGYKNYRIPGLLVTAKGTVLATCEARRTSGKDWDQIDILLRRSTDGGRTWSARRPIANVPGPKLKNPLALAVPNVDPTTVTSS